jgi:hypothetical protein
VQSVTNLTWSYAAAVRAVLSPSLQWQPTLSLGLPATVPRPRQRIAGPECRRRHVLPRCSAELPQRRSHRGGAARCGRDKLTCTTAQSRWRSAFQSGLDLSVKRRDRQHAGRAEPPVGVATSGPPPQVWEVSRDASVVSPALHPRTPKAGDEQMQIQGGRLMRPHRGPSLRSFLAGSKAG